MDENTLYWLFSTIAQTYGAIIGIVGLLTVYKLENQTRLRGSIKERIINSKQKEILIEIFTSDFVAWSAEEMSSRFHKPNSIQEKMLLEKFNPGDRNYLKGEMKRLSNSVTLDEDIKRGFKSFIKFHMPLILASIFLLYIVPLPLLLPTCYQLVTRPIIFGIVLIALSIALIQSFRQIWSITMTLLEEKMKGG